MDLSIDEVKNQITDKSLRRGRRYFQEGHVSSLQQQEEQVTATVQGSNPYSVQIKQKAGDILGDCSCPYDWGGYCKHIVAVILAVESGASGTEVDRSSHESQEEPSNEELIEQVEELDEQTIRSFLKEQLQINDELRTNFRLTIQTPPLEELEERCRSLVREAYQRASDRHGYVDWESRVDFSRVKTHAQQLLDSGRPRKAARMYRVLSEEIAGRMEFVDDSSGYYGTEFGVALSEYTTCLNRADLDDEQKQHHLRYLTRKFLERAPDYFQDDYRGALDELITSQQDREFVADRLREHLPEPPTSSSEDHTDGTNSYAIRAHVQLYTEILSELDRDEERISVLEQFKTADSNLSLKLAKAYREADRKEEARELLRSQIDQYSFHQTKKHRRLLLELLGPDDREEQLTHYKALYLHTGNESDYKALKGLVSEDKWSDVRADLLEQLRDRRSSRPLIDFLLLEGEDELAYDHVVQEEKLDLLVKYQDRVAEVDPEKYFEAYREQLVPFAASRTGRSHYKKIVRYLNKIRDLELDEKFRTFVEELNEQFSNRPAFLDEMQSVNMP